MSEPTNLAELLNAMKAVLEKRETTVGEAYLQATSVVLNLAPRLVKAFDVILRTVPCTCQTMREEQRPCELCKAESECDRIAAGKE